MTTLHRECRLRSHSRQTPVCISLLLATTRNSDLSMCSLSLRLCLLRRLRRLQGRFCRLSSSRPWTRQQHGLYVGVPSLFLHADHPGSLCELLGEDYFIFNLGLTLYNKLVLVKFPFPWTVTAIHTLCGGIGSSILQSQGVFDPASLGTRENLILGTSCARQCSSEAETDGGQSHFPFCTLSTLPCPISVSISLRSRWVPYSTIIGSDADPHTNWVMQFHQVVRAMTPLFTIAIAAAFLHKRHARKTYLSLIPVVMGVGFATYGDYYVCCPPPNPPLDLKLTALCSAHAGASY